PAEAASLGPIQVSSVSLPRLVPNGLHATRRKLLLVWSGPAYLCPECRRSTRGLGERYVGMICRVHGRMSERCFLAFSGRQGSVRQFQRRLMGQVEATWLHEDRLLFRDHR